MMFCKAALQTHGDERAFSVHLLRTMKSKVAMLAEQTRSLNG